MSDSEFENYHRKLNGLQTYNMLKETADTPEEQKEFRDIELRALKRKKFKYNKDVGAFMNEEGTKAKSVQEANIRNQIVRKEASLHLNSNEELNKFMTAADWETYRYGPKHIREPFTSALDNVVKRGKKKLLEKPKATPEVQPTVAQPDPLFITLDQTRRELSELKKNEPKMNLETPRDPDLERGIGYLMGVKN